MQPAPGIWDQLPFFAAILAIFYFFIIRPQSRKLKEHQSLIGGLKRGDEVITNGGILGIIEGITEKFITLKIDDGVKIKILKTQIAGLAAAVNKENA